MAYTPTTWVDGSTPALDALNLNNIETGIDGAHAMLGEGVGLSGSFLLNNNIALQSKDTGGTARSVLSMGTDNLTRVGPQTAPASGGDLLFYSNGSERGRFTSAGVLSLGPGGTPSYNTDATSAVVSYNPQGTRYNMFGTARGGRFVDGAVGTSGSPDLSPNTVIKAHRTIGHTRAQLDVFDTGDGQETLAAINGTCVATSSCEVQPIGVSAYASSSSTTGIAGNDACAFAAIGRITATGGTGGAIGAGIGARSDSTLSTSRATAMELVVHNNSGTANAYDPADSRFRGLWMVPMGTKCGTGIHFGQSSGVQWDVGIGFGSSTSGSVTGPCASASIRDDSTATNSILVKGTHSGGSIVVDAGAGPAIFGGTTPIGWTNGRLEVQGPTGTDVDGLIAVGNTSSTNGYSMIWQLSNGIGRMFIAGFGDDWMTGTAGGDIGLQIHTDTKKVHIGGTSSVIAVTRENTLGLFNVTPVSKRTGWAAATGTATRTTFDTATVSTANLAQRVKALIDDLTSYGLIGA